MAVVGACALIGRLRPSYLGAGVLAGLGGMLACFLVASWIVGILVDPV